MSAPSLFISHGAPSLAIHKTAAHDFLKTFGAELEGIRGVVIVSAHFETDVTTVVSDPAPETVYDFRGFPAALYEITYPAPGAPELADRVATLLEAAGIRVETSDKRGYDHGIWVPLRLMRPDADWPIVQVSIQPDAGPAAHYALGQALHPLRQEGILILGSGAATHNLHEFFSNDYALDTPAPDWVRAHGDWLSDQIAAGDHDALLDYRARAPFAEKNHPTEDHILPLFVALGAGGPGQAGRRVHSSEEYGVLMMDMYAFG
ncbi:MAG: class III extradiol ring-cleavage dioxygenase [Pseudomonadota bacterium]